MVVGIIFTGWRPDGKKKMRSSLENSAT